MVYTVYTLTQHYINYKQSNFSTRILPNALKNQSICCLDYIMSYACDDKGLHNAILIHFHSITFSFSLQQR